MATRNASRTRRARPTLSRAAAKRTDGGTALRAELRRREEELLDSDVLRSVAPEDAERLLDDAFDAIRSAARDGAAGRVPARAGARLGATLMGAATAADSDITDELEKGGPAFGAFLKGVGLAVAEAQQKLDANLVETAEALSKTEINVIAVFEQNIDDNGNMTNGNPIIQKLPLINYLMPTAYQWSRVYLQADMAVSEFNGANGFNISGKSSSVSVGASVGYGLFSGFSGSASVRAGSSSFEQSVQTSVSRDSASGTMHMEATLEPRGDIQLPRPFVLQRGPQLKLSASGRTDITQPAVPPATQPTVVGRKVTVTASLTARSGGNLDGKTLDVQVSDPALTYNILTNPAVTTNGKLDIEVRREGSAFDATRPPAPALVRVWMGLVSAEIGITV